MNGRAVTIAAGAVLRHPLLWPTAFAVARRMARRGWWRRPPFLPLPSDDYVRFRMVTQYGDADASPTADDVVSYLRWCRSLTSSRG